MNKIVMATAIALVAGSPLAFAKSLPVNEIDPTTMSCSVLQYDFSQAKFKSEAARQIAEERDMSLCRENKDPGERREAGHPIR